MLSRLYATNKKLCIACEHLKKNSAEYNKKTSSFIPLLWRDYRIKALFLEPVTVSFKKSYQDMHPYSLKTLSASAKLLLILIFCKKKCMNGITYTRKLTE
jgi:hypothetical protein